MMIPERFSIHCTALALHLTFTANYARMGRVNGFSTTLGSRPGVKNRATAYWL
jgi:hypothetical protein